MTVGILDIGNLISNNVLIIVLLTTGGCIFLLWYAYRAFKSAFSSLSYIDIHEGKWGAPTIKKDSPGYFSDSLVEYIRLFGYGRVMIGGIGGILSYRQKINFLIGPLFMLCI